jgi:hypothetical protein
VLEELQHLTQLEDAGFIETVKVGKFGPRVGEDWPVSTG